MHTMHIFENPVTFMHTITFKITKNEAIATPQDYIQQNLHFIND